MSDARDQVGLSKVALLSLACAALVVIGLVIWGKHTVAADGSICGSAWHFWVMRRGTSGGQVTPSEQEAIAHACRVASRGSFLTGAALVASGLVAGAFALRAALGGRSMDTQETSEIY
ncbi:exported hypothetical protein [Nostocoides japonicum T1-X7]|uniref:Transmembrane protein n=1 Tax=Nostocoides japonicum T1-X7 TaxID=1194083 RepID=A0A077M1U3_9MICO|nr:exported hypothetical protein [Tetrasphaera japonica T1-X7]